MLLPVLKILCMDVQSLLMSVVDHTTLIEVDRPSSRTAAHASRCQSTALPSGEFTHVHGPYAAAVRAGGAIASRLRISHITTTRTEEHGS